MLYCDRIDIYEGIDVNMTSKSEVFTIFATIGFKQKI